MPSVSLSMDIRHVIAILGLFAAALSAQEVEIRSPAECPGPIVVTCGGLASRAGPPGTTRAVTLVDDESRVVRGTVIERERSAVVRAVLPSLKAGSTRLTVRDRGAAERPWPVNLTRDRFETFVAGEPVVGDWSGRVTVGDAALELVPPSAVGGTWDVFDRDAVRVVLRFTETTAPGDVERRLLVTIDEDVLRLRARLVLTRSHGDGFSQATGLRVRAADGARDDAGDEDDVDETPPGATPRAQGLTFEDVMSCLESGAQDVLAPPGVSWSVQAARVGQGSPCRFEMPFERAAIAVAGDRDSDLAVGQTRILDVVVSLDGLLVPDVLARPLPATGKLGVGSGTTSNDQAALAGCLDEALDAWVSDPRHGLGWKREDFGDWAMDRWRVGNCEWDTSLGLWWRWVETGQPRWGRLARAAAEHYLCVDRDAGRTGLAFQHGARHRSGVVEAGHHWIEGARLVSEGLDDPWMRDEVAVAAREQLSFFEKLDWSREIPRSIGWGLTALCAVDDIVAEHARSDAVIRRATGLVLARQARSGHFLIEPAESKAGHFRVSPFVDGGVLLPALVRAGQRARRTSLGDPVRRAFSAVWRDAMREVDGAVYLASSVVVEPTAGRVERVTGAAEGEEVALFLAGARSCNCEDAKAGRLLASAVQSLRIREKTFLGKEISMLLRSVPVLQRTRRRRRAPRWRVRQVRSREATRSGLAELVECALEVRGDLARITALDLPTLDQSHQLPRLEQRDGRRTWGGPLEIRPHAGDGFHVLTGEDRRDHVGFDRVLQRQREARPRSACRATANGVHEDERRSVFVGQHGIDVGRGHEFLHAEAGHLFAHRFHEHRVIRHRACSTGRECNEDVARTSACEATTRASARNAWKVPPVRESERASVACTPVRESPTEEPRMQVLITGGTGFVGQAVHSKLVKRKDSVRVMTRNVVAAVQALGQEVQTVSPDSGPKAWMAGVNAVVNLAGEPIFGKRWSARQKDVIRRSRVEGTRRLVDAMAAQPAEQRPKVLVSASAVGFYGPRGDEELDESGAAGTDFLAGVCREWEDSALRANDLGVRVVIVRIGVVLGPHGGALAQMMPFFRMGGGGPIGNGRQWFSWVHRDDLAALILHGIDTPALSGPVNAAAPGAMTNGQFAKALGKALRRPAFLPTPPLALRLLFGESASILTTGQHVVPRKAIESGFKFQFPTVDVALGDILPKW